MKVVNMKRTSKDRPKNGRDWIDNWEQIKGRKAGTCSCADCSNKAEVGGHVQIPIIQNNSIIDWGESYIVPLCTNCNLMDGDTDTYTVFYVDASNVVPLSDCRNKE